MIFPLSVFTGMDYRLALPSLLDRLMILIIPIVYYYCLKRKISSDFIYTALIICASVMVYYGALNYLYNTRSFTTSTGDERYLYGAAFVVFTFTFFHSYFKSPKSLLDFYSLFISILGILMVNHRSGIIFFLIVFALGNLLNDFKISKLIWMIFIVSLTFIIISNINSVSSTLSMRMNSVSTKDQTANERFERWGWAFDYFLENPINGSLLTERYYKMGGDINYFPPHNFIFEILSTQGLVGIFFYLFLLIRSMSLAVKNRKRDDNLELFLQIMAYILFASFNATFFDAWVFLYLALPIAKILYNDETYQELNQNIV